MSLSPKKIKEDALESSIVNLLAQHNETGIKLAYRAYGGAVFNIILKVLKDKDLAEEVLQDVFVKAWQKGHTYDSQKGRLFTWLANIARNTAIDRTRTAKFKQATKTESYDPLVFTNDALSEEMKLEDSGLNKIIKGLEDKHRLLIDLVYFQGYTQKEAAEKTKIPLGTIKSRLRAAIKVLRRQLGHKEQH